MNNIEEAKRYLDRFNELKPFEDVTKIDMSTKGMSLVLRYLDEHRDNAVLAGDLALALNVSTARIAILLNKMEKNGLVLRQSLKSDLRKTVVTLTQKGEEKICSSYKKTIEFIAKLIDEVGLDTLNQFLDSANKIKMAIRKE